AEARRCRRRRCRWASTTATTATRSSRTPPPPAGATSRAPSTTAPAPSESHGGPSPLLQPDGAILGQGVCNHFVRTGTCKFGDACRYFHPKPHAVNPALAPSGPVPGAMGQQSNFLGTQPNFVGYPAVEGNSFSGNILTGHTSWGNLPPSLQPPPEGGYPPLPFVDWG
uniref:C3H1-type domain-containing protein n=1 Tax=Triticum urartu TaxID=4572 RepID=A0A8R7TUI3_TRIUA